MSAGVSRQVTLLFTGSFAMQPTLTVATGRDSRLVSHDVDGRAIERTGKSLVIRLGDPQLRYETARVLVLGGRAQQVAGVFADTAPLVLLLDGAPVVVGTLAADWAPDTWLAYRGLDAILWTEPDLAELADPAQLRALLEWVQFGGRLALLSARRPALLDDEGWRGVLPCRDAELTMRPYPRPDGVAEADFDARGAVLTAERARGAREARRTAEGPAWVEALPLALVRPYGSGTLAVARFDPLVYDLGDASVLARALGRASGLGLRHGPSPEPDPSLTPWSSFAAAGLGGSAFHGVVANGNAMAPPLGLFFLFGIAFLLLIGPADWKLLSRLRRLHLSPWTLTAYTLVVSVVALALTTTLFAPSEQLNRVAILDFTEGPDGAESVHGLLFHGLYSPFGTTALPLVEGFQQYGGLVGKPDDDSYRVPDASALRQGAQVYLGPGVQVPALRMPFNSLRVSEQVVSGRPRGTLTCELRRAGARLELVVHNGLDTALSEALVATSQGAFALPNVDPGESITARLEDQVDLRVPSRNAWWTAGGGGTGRPQHLVRFVQATSVDELSGGSFGETIDRYSDPPCPWDLSRLLDDDRAVFLAATDRLPFADALDDRPQGFTAVVVRRVLEMPR